MSVTSSICLGFILAVLTAQACVIWCGYLQCTKDCDESAMDGICHVCKCSCGNSTCMENYYCLYGRVSPDDPMSKPQCCNNTANNDPNHICLLPGEKNISKALPNF